MADNPADISWLSSDDPPDSFPDPETGLNEPNGLLAVGGDLTPERLIAAYTKGIFPWFNPGQPVLWWSPNPRTVIYPDQLHISRSLRRTMRREGYSVSCNRDFAAVIDACADLRQDSGTWITRNMAAAYKEMHQIGRAHSIEAWANDELIGGIYGVCIGSVFFGESMFSTATDASKTCLVYLRELMQANGGAVLDCQLHSEHLASMGAKDIPRRRFIEELRAYTVGPDFIDGSSGPLIPAAALQAAGP